ncbi:hypothetical protein [Marinactinospora rubrisoli]|uniref:Uncharacterized protein n=1 Tax=Marinactinospora rubrisoli TaxID=2715399 RepID=A0ABW2KDZ4_9ACTN
MSGTPGRSRFKAFTPGLAALAAMLLAVTGCGGDSVDTAALEGGPSPDATYGGAVPAVEAPAADELAPTDIEGVEIGVPDGWEASEADGMLCIRPPGQDECGYGAVQVRPHAAQRDDDNWPKRGDAFNQDDGWAARPDACRSLSTAEAGDVGIASATQDVADFTEHADGLKSHHSVWTVTCENDETFEVRLWFLPKSDVAVYVWSVDAQYAAVYDQIAASMDVTAYND